MDCSASRTKVFSFGLSAWRLVLLILLSAGVGGRCSADDPPREPASGAGSLVGHGDGRIHIIPALSAPSVKNGGKLTVQAVVKAVAGVREVRAEILDGDRVVDSLELKSGSGAMGGAPDGIMGPFEAVAQTSATAMGLWSADWAAHGLEEKHYRVRLRVTDGAGHSFEDSSLAFSDPIAGNATPGTTNYPDSAMRRIGTYSSDYEVLFASAVIDEVNGYAYFGTGNAPGAVVKVALGAGAAPPTRVGAVTLDIGEKSLVCAAIDTTNGYAYFGTGTSPGIVVKVALGAGASAPTRVEAVTLNTGENNPRCAVIDAANGYAYFGTTGTPAIVVKVALGAGDSPPTRAGAVTLNTGENDLRCAVIDAASGYAYFGTYTAPGRVVKVALGAGAAAPTRVGAVTLIAGDFGLVSAVIDAANGYAYFGTDSTGAARVVKVALGAGAAAPTRVGAVTLNSGEVSLRSAVIDDANGYAYFGTLTAPAPGIVIKVALGAGAAAPTRVGAVTLDAGEAPLTCAAIDAASGYAYFGSATSNTSSPVVKVDLGAGAAAPTRVGAVTLNVGENFFLSAVIDPANGFGYFGTSTDPGIVVKVELGVGASPPTRVGAVTLDPGESFLPCAVIDAANGYAYFGTSAAPGIVVKVALGVGAAPPTRVGALTLDPGENNLRSAAIDAANGYAYFGTSTNPGRVVKVALGAGAALPTRVGAVTLNTGEINPRSAAIDVANGYAYFGTETSPGIVVKVDLGAGAAAPTRVGAVTMNTGENGLLSAVIDPVDGYGYFGTSFTSTGSVVKVALGAGAAAPVRVGAVTLNVGEGPLLNAAIDPIARYAYFGSNLDPGVLVKVALGDGAASPTRVGAVLADSSADNNLAAAIDPVNGYAYVAGTKVGRVSKVAYSQAGHLRATRFTMPEAGGLTAANLYSHVASGNVRLALYDDDPDTKTLIWESVSTPNTATEEFVSAAALDGTPATPPLLLPGTYWLAWQVDSTADVPSYTQGAPGDGFYISQAYGSFPAGIGTTSATSTDEVWTSTISYDYGPKIENVIYNDANNNGLVEAGESVSLIFDQSVIVSPGLISQSSFYLPVTGDSLGGAGFAASANAYNSRLIDLTLGTGASLQMAGDFNIGNTGSGSPSGIDVAAAINPGAIVSLTTGIPAFDGGVYGVNDSAIDVLFAVVANTAIVGAGGGTVTVTNSPNAAYTKHAITIPGGSFLKTGQALLPDSPGPDLTVTLQAPPINLGVIGAVQIVTNNPSVTFSPPATLHIEYLPSDVDTDNGQIESTMRIHQLVETSPGVFEWLPVLGTQTVDTNTRTVSVDVPNLNPRNSVSGPRIFANIAGETIKAKTYNIGPAGRPGENGVIRDSPAVVVIAGDPAQSIYSQTRIEIPGYMLTTISDPARTEITIDHATLADRVALGSGVSFPTGSSAFFVIRTRNAVGAPIAFTDPVDIYTQFIDGSQPGYESFHDVVDLEGAERAREQMRLVKDVLDGAAVDFHLVEGLTQSVVTNLGGGVVEAHDVIGLTGPSGKGVWGAAADPNAPVQLSIHHWEFYE